MTQKAFHDLVEEITDDKYGDVALKFQDYLVDEPLLNWPKVLEKLKFHSFIQDSRSI